MIPQAIANTGPYSGLWSRIKSMMHALDRVLEAKTHKDLSELDRSRIFSLVKFLKFEASKKICEEPLEYATLSSTLTRDPSYFLEVDVLDLIKDLPEFQNWNHYKSLGVEKRLNKILETVQNYAQTASFKTLIANDPPREEINILRALLG